MKGFSFFSRFFSRLKMYALGTLLTVEKQGRKDQRDILGLKSQYSCLNLFYNVKHLKQYLIHTKHCKSVHYINI